MSLVGMMFDTGDSLLYVHRIPRFKYGIKVHSDAMNETSRRILRKTANFQFFSMDISGFPSLFYISSFPGSHQIAASSKEDFHWTV